MYGTEGKIWVAASIILYKKIFCLFKTKNLKNIHAKNLWNSHFASLSFKQIFL